MEKSTEDQSPTYSQMTFKDLRSAIFSPESEAGHSPCNSQDGARIVLSGPDLAPVSHSAKPVNKKPKKTNDISGRRCTGSSASVSLSKCLASRLRQQLDTDGLMEYRMIWREKITPLGRSYWEHSASAHRTSDPDYTGWPTPAACETTGAETVESKRARGSGGINLQQAATLTPWGTPASRDWKDGHQVDVQTNSLLGRQAWLSTASMENRGVLDAAFSRWLMGFPLTWDEASPSFQDWQNVQGQIALGV